MTQRLTSEHGKVRVFCFRIAVYCSQSVTCTHRTPSGSFFRFGGPLKNLSLTKTQPFGSDGIDPIQKYRGIFLASQKIKQ